jgi:hypothetical protein
MRRQACFFAFSPSKKAGAPGLFNVNSLVRAKTKLEAKRVGKYMLKLTFVVSKPPPPRIAYQEVLMAAEAGAEYFS